MNAKSIMAGIALPLLAASTGAMAQDAAAAAAVVVEKGDVAWMMLSTLLVIMMAIPGLALFYGGLVRTKNMLSVLMQVMVVFSLIAVLWAAYGYSLAFGGEGLFIADFSKAFLLGVTSDSLADTFTDNVKIPEYIFIAFQATFAGITCALIVGSFAERMKFAAVLAFCVLWFTFAYLPIAHMVWGSGGYLLDKGALDFAGGTVVHINAGVAGLVGAYVLGPRLGYGREAMAPHSLTLTMVGAALLWVGWFGFNAGSQGGASGAAGMTMLVTHISAATAALVWCLVERIQTGKTGVVGIATGMVAGLATITPASGNVGPMGALLIGLLAGVICYFMCGVVRHKLNIDDSLDVFAVHGVGGILGTIMVAFLGAEGVLGGLGLSENPETGETYSSIEQLIVQLKSLGITIVWSAVATIIIVLIIKKTVGLRVSEEVEAEGLDSAEHGETAYNFDA